MSNYPELPRVEFVPGESFMDRERRIRRLNVEAGFEWTARCCCYDGHESASGRCRTRDVWFPHGQKPVCERCWNQCRGMS